MTSPSARAGGADAPPAAAWPVPLIPTRALTALAGSRFAHRIDGLSASDRQRSALDQLERGNLPTFLRTFVPVALTGHASNGRTVVATIYVLPDYLAIGSDQDFVYVPLAYAAATAVARDFGCVLPTAKMVDAIHAQAARRLEPAPLPAGPLMRSMTYLLAHQRRIDEQRRGALPGELISGHKKDLVLSNRLLEHPGRIAIYGWHRSNERPIQPLSTIHGEAYADYSHGLRLVSDVVLVDGHARSILDILEDPSVAPALTYEGVMHDVRGLMGLPRAVVAGSSVLAGSVRR